jgi:phospholipase/carboxylesterase
MTIHRDTPTLESGAPLASAAGAILLLHGRGGSARDILALGEALQPPGTIALLAPQATNSTWYPQSFLALREQNEPYLSAALERIATEVARIEAAGISTDRIVIAGFSQGACLATEFVASQPGRFAGHVARFAGHAARFAGHAARFAGLIALTGGLIGPPGTEFHHAGSLGGTPALLVGGDPDPHVPWGRVEESARVLAAMGATVTTHRYPGKPHSVSGEEVVLARALVASTFGS